MPVTCCCPAPSIHLRGWYIVDWHGTAAVRNETGCCLFHAPIRPDGHRITFTHTHTAGGTVPARANAPVHPPV